MIAFKIIPFGITVDEKESVEKAIEIFNECQCEFKLDCCDPIKLSEQGDIDWPTNKSNLSRTFSESRIIAVTSHGFDDGWFSHTEDKVSIISTSDWKLFFSPPGLHCYILMEFALSMYFHASNVSEMDTDPHYETDGCLLDMCDNKIDCRWKIKVGYICEKHSANFRRFGGTEEQLEAIQAVLDEVRRVSLGRPPLLKKTTTNNPSTEFTIDSIKKHPIVVAATLVVIGLGIGWGVAWKLWIDPKNEKITTLEKQIEKEKVVPSPISPTKVKTTAEQQNQKQ
jgi:hypothetical protein